MIKIEVTQNYKMFKAGEILNTKDHGKITVGHLVFMGVAKVLP